LDEKGKLSEEFINLKQQDYISFVFLSGNVQELAMNVICFKSVILLLVSF
jgi:hypothetical protein